MTTDRPDPRRLAAAVTTGVVSVATGVTVAWAAAHPVHQAAQSSTPTATPAVDPTALQDTARQLAAARADLAAVRADLARTVAAEDRLPRAADTSIGQVPVAAAMPLPAAPAAAPAPVTVVQAAPPPVQANTGASGAR